ncbi:hypothetical protein PG988_005329 [Apiospora saccharicola]
MIDGLDKCSGDQLQLIELITKLAEDTGNLKLCVASQPWSNFEDAFKSRPSLMLQDITAADIELYVTSKFSASEGFAGLQVRDPLGAKSPLESIPNKAEGVFLWVHLVVRSLLEGLTNGDGLRDLTKRLEELAPKLEDLYVHILENLDENYLDHASQLFQVVRACDDSPNLLRIALADSEDSEMAMRAPVKPMSSRAKSALCKNMKRKLLSRCRGLLDVSSTTLQYTYGDIAHDFRSENEMDVAADAVAMADLEVQYLHRSGRDYIQNPSLWSWLRSANQEPFDPHLSPLKSHLLHFKGLPSDSLTTRVMGFHIWMAIKYAKRSFNIFPKKKLQGRREVARLLDEMDETATVLTSSHEERCGSIFVDRLVTLEGEHWSCFFISKVSDPSFLHVMAVGGVHQYLCTRLRHSNLNNKNNDNNTNRKESD